MDIKNVSIALMVASVVTVLATFVYLKASKAMVEKSFAYGIFASVVAQFMSVLLIGGSSAYALFMNALFLSMVFYNVVVMFGFRFAKMHESVNQFFSFFAGFSIVGNVMNLFFFGASSYLITIYSKSPEYVEVIGEDVLNLLMDSLSVSLGENMIVLFVSLVCAIVVSYVSLRLFTISYKKHVIRTNLKGMLALFAYYLVSVFVPGEDFQVTIQCALYILTTLASYIIYLQSRNDEPSIKVMMM